MMRETMDALRASDFSDPRKVARIVQQIGAHGTDIKKNAADPMGDGDQSVLLSDGPDAKYLREVWSTGGDVADLCQSGRMDPFALKCITGNRAGVQAALEACTSA